MNFLHKGLKFCTEHRLKTLDLLAMFQNDDGLADDPSKDRCIKEGVDCRLLKPSRGARFYPTPKLAMDYLLNNQLRLLVADNTRGRGVLCSKASFHVRAWQAIENNFETVSFPSLPKVISRAKQLWTWACRTWQRGCRKAKA